MSELPSEIWTHILSYNSLPYCHDVCTDLMEIEESLADIRANNIFKMYEGFVCVAMHCKDWDSVNFMIDNHHKDFLLDIGCSEIIQLISHMQIDILRKLKYKLESPIARIILFIHVLDETHDPYVTNILIDNFVTRDELRPVIEKCMAAEDYERDSRIFMYLFMGIFCLDVGTFMKLYQDILSAHNMDKYSHEAMYDIMRIAKRDDLIRAMQNHSRTCSIL